MINKDELKNNLTIEQVFDIIQELGGSPTMSSDGSFFIAETICHNPIGKGSHKLYYYDNSHTFTCYTNCGGPKDIFQVICDVKNQTATFTWTLPTAIRYVTRFFNIVWEDDEEEALNIDNGWDVFKRYDKLQDTSKEKKQNIEIKLVDDKILRFLPKPRIAPWERDGISKDIIALHNIAYDPVNEGIVIPHYDMNGKLIGIRERTLIKDNEVNGKYRPAILNGTQYNHPLGFNLYNLNISKDNIKKYKKAIIFEGEKSPMLYQTYFGLDNDISVAGCGSSITAYQIGLLRQCGAEEICIAFDKQFKKIGDEEYRQWVKKLKALSAKYKNLVNLSFIFDTKNCLDYKDAPIDKGAEIFTQLFIDRLDSEGH